MRSILLANKLYGPTIGITVVSVFIQVICLVAKMLAIANLGTGFSRLEHINLSIKEFG